MSALVRTPRWVLRGLRRAGMLGVFCLTLLGVFELGLQLRSWMDRVLATKTDRVSPAGPIRVLLIGDSVLGVPNQADSIADEMIREMQRRYPNRYEVYNVSIPGNTTAQVAAQIHESLTLNRPHLVVMLLGNTDLLTPKNRATEAPSGWVLKAAHVLEHTNLQRFFVLATHHVRLWQGRLSALGSIAHLSSPPPPPPPQPRRTPAHRLQKNELIQIAWSLYDDRKFEQAIEKFEALVRLDPEFRRAIMVLNSCYHRTGLYERGIAFFNQLSVQSQERHLLEQLVLALSVARQELAVDSSFSQWLPYPVDRDSYISALWIYKKRGLVRQGNALFIESDQFSSSADGRLDIGAFRKVVHAIRETGAEVLALQYPNQIDWPVLNAVSPFSKGVTFFSLRSVFFAELQRQKNPGNEAPSVFRFFDEDFMHVTPIGAQILGAALAEQIARLDVSRRGDLQ